MKKAIYVGVFPPPYGGVTVKNVLVANEIERFTNTIRINLYDSKRIISNAIRIIKAIIDKNVMVIGLDSKRLKAFICVLSFFPQSLSRASIFLMGGLAADIIINDPLLRKNTRKSNAILVETNTMRHRLEEYGFMNVKTYPNCKSIRGSIEPDMSDNGALKLVYFSQVSEEKGILFVEEAIAILNRRGVLFILDIYGNVAETIKESFYRFVDKYPQVNYKGIFNSAQDNVYEKLHEYDVMLFPSQWKAEGVPGVLVESKMAGITVIASDIAYNEEIINEANDEGLIIHGDMVEGLVEKISELSENRDLLKRLKTGSYRSRYRYSSETYRDMLKETLCVDG